MLDLLFLPIVYLNTSTSNVRTVITNEVNGDNASVQTEITNNVNNNQIRIESSKSGTIKVVTTDKDNLIESDSEIVVTSASADLSFTSPDASSSTQSMQNSEIYFQLKSAVKSFFTNIWFLLKSLIIRT